MLSIIMDVEATDKEPQTCEVVEAAYREFLFDPVPEIPHRFIERYGHVNPIKFGALASHHILPEELVGLPLFDKGQFCAVVGAVPYWIGHNIDFDWAAVGAPKQPKRICTLAMSRHLWPKLDSHTLTSLVYFTQGASKETRERLRSAHSALADVIFCEEILRVIIAEKGITSMEQLYAYSEEARVPKIMTFGKFKDQPVENVDRGYANWYRRQADTDPYLLEAFRRVGLI